jgi:hypothetical protein
VAAFWWILTGKTKIFPFLSYSHMSINVRLREDFFVPENFNLSTLRPLNSQPEDHLPLILRVCKSNFQATSPSSQRFAA